MTTIRGSAVLLDGQLPDLASEISARLIMTPIDQLVSTTLDAPVAVALKKMGRTFDQLPVVVDGKLLGLLFRSRISHDASSTTPISSFLTKTSEICSIRACEGLIDVIAQLKSHEACVVFDQTTGRFCGLIHFSDLNRQAARVFCYLWTSALEMAMAELLANIYPCHNSWIDALSQHRQVQVLGRYEFGRRQNIELSPVEGLELSDFINIWPRRKELLDVFGMSKSQFRARANHLVELRNGSMHPVRSLVSKHVDVPALCKRLHDVQLLVKCSSSALRKLKKSDQFS